ncbi:uncharacterized protein LOC134273420 [Saccostrea cucullata]|uniref:uncharacterized protein LOC134273420 n=1 Tax=Saccostrea cuccullata TaxID=36930 RepID=UPI002ED05957
MADVKEKNFLKLIWLLMKYGAKVLQHRIEYELRNQKWQKLCDFLQEKKHDIFHLTLSKKCCKCPVGDDYRGKPPLPKDVLGQLYENLDQCCSPKFRGCCCCKLSPHTDLNKHATELDITLTSCLLKNFLIEDLGQKQVIENIRKLRNDKELLHKGNAEVDGDSFARIWLQLSNAIKEVAEKCEPYFYSEIRVEVDRLKTRPLSKEDTISSINTWKELQEEFGSPVDRQQISELCQRLTQVCSDVATIATQLQDVRFPKNNPELESLLSYTESQLKAHEKKIYVEPKRAMQHCLKNMEKHRFICITGEAGSGKTSFGLQLMQHIRRKNLDCTPIILTESSQWFKFISPDKKFIIFVDDIIGKSSVSERDFEEWRRVFDAMHLRVSDDKFPTFVIFSLRNCIWGLKKDEFKGYILFNLFKTSNVDLSGSDFGMTIKQKKSMLYSYCKCYKISVCWSESEENRSFEVFDPSALCLCEETLNNIAQSKTVSGFPLLCEEFFSNPESLKQRSNFFTINSACNHFKKLVDDLLCKKMYLHYVILVLFFLEVLTEKVYSIQEIMKQRSKIKEIAEKIYLFHFISHQLNKAEIQGSLQDLQNTFVHSTDDGYKLKHMVVYEAILLSFGESFPSPFLELVNRNDLFTFVRSHNYKPEKWEICVHLEDDMTEALARKLIDIFAPNTFDAYTVVYQHPSFNDEQLVSCFLDIVEEDPKFRAFLDSFVAGACSYKRDILASETVKRFSSVFIYDSDILNVILTHDLIETFNQFINNFEFRKILVAHILEEDADSTSFFHVASMSCSKRCFFGILDLLLSKDDELEIDRDKLDVFSRNTVFGLIIGTLTHPYESTSIDLKEELIKLTELMTTENGKQLAYKYIVKISLSNEKFDIALEYLPLIHVVSFTYEDVLSVLYTCINHGRDEFFNVFCKKIKGSNLIDSKMVNVLLALANIGQSENMVMKFLHEFNNLCDYNFTLRINGDTILHMFERHSISDVNMLFILQRPEGEFMFTKVNNKGLTPVQCRRSYPKLRTFLSMENLLQYSPYDTEGQYPDIGFSDDMQLLYQPNTGSFTRT